jgi:hypothetical protein
MLLPWLSNGTFTFIAAQDMDMGTNMGTIKHSGYQNVIGPKECAAYRAFPL